MIDPVKTMTGRTPAKKDAAPVSKPRTSVAAPTSAAESEPSKPRKRAVRAAIEPAAEGATPSAEHPGKTSPVPPPAAAQAVTPTGTRISSSRGLSGWLKANDLSIGFTSYQSGRLYLVGRSDKGGVSFHERFFQRAMGLWGSPQRLLLSTIFQVWRFENVLGAGEVFRVREGAGEGDYDRHFVPRFATTTGDLDVHEIGVMGDGRIVFVNTAYSCLATLSPTHSFKPYWVPPFISKLAPEDRCHLNGMAMRDGKPRYVTMVSRSDSVNGWRERRGEGGLVMDVETNTIVTDKLSMPHSPRYVDGRLYVLNSGLGQFGEVDLKSGAFRTIAFCPGFLRGMAIHRGHAIIGLSLPRDGTFKGLALDGELAKRDAAPWCGLQVVELSTGNIVQWIRMEGEVSELFDVCALPGVRRPMATGTLTDDIHRFVTIDNSGDAARVPAAG